MNLIKKYLRIVLISCNIVLAAFFVSISINTVNPLGIELKKKATTGETKIVILKKFPPKKDTAIKVGGNLIVRASGDAVALNVKQESVPSQPVKTVTEEIKIIPAGFTLIDLEKAKRLFDEGSAKFLDARPEYKWLEAHIKGSYSLSASRFEKQYEDVKTKISPDDVLVIYCSNLTCKLSEHVAEYLEAKGFKKLYVFEGGWSEWEKAGYPIEGLKVQK